MDEYNSGWDPEVKLYFRKIMKTFSSVIVWLMVMAPLAFFFKLALVRETWRWPNTVFYIVFLLSLAALIRYLVRLWKKNAS